MKRICTKCATLYTDEPWRMGCKRCGSLVVAFNAQSEGAALNVASRYRWVDTDLRGPRLVPRGQR